MMPMPIRERIPAALTLLMTLLLAGTASAGMFRDIDAIGTTVDGSGVVRGEFDLVGEPGEADSILLRRPFVNQRRIVDDILGFPAGQGVELDRAVVRFYVSNGNRGEEVEMDVEIFRRDVGELEFERRFGVFRERLNGRIRGRISETGIARYTLELEGSATVHYGSLTVFASNLPETAMPEPSAALLWLVGLVTLRRGVRRSRDG